MSKDRFSPANMLQAHRDNASVYMKDQAKAFRAMAASDQRELLFYLMANMAVSNAAKSVLDELEPKKELQ